MHVKLTEREVQAGIARDKPEGDGIPNASDSTGSQFKVAVTEPDGTLSYHTRDAPGINEIELRRTMDQELSTQSSVMRSQPDGEITCGFM